MGNCILRAICGKGSDTKTDAAAEPGVPNRISAATAGVSALAADLLHFDITNQVPEGLSQHVTSSKKAQINWYRKLLEAWRDAKPPPKTPEDAAKLIVQTLKRHQKADVEGLLNYYGLPLAKQTGSECATHHHTASNSKLKPDGVKYELNTLPVDIKCIADGDTITVFADATIPHESCKVPPEIKRASKEYIKASTTKNVQRANNLRKTITDAGYRMMPSQNGNEILAKKYRIRLRGIDAPESAMPYGKEAKEELVKLIKGKKLKIYVYGDDRYGRCVGDVYCGRIFIQEHMLKKGFAWHYTAYDQRPELEMWEKEARMERVGLWTQKKPEKPWEWRKEQRNGS
ncbi:Ca(2+)-dependent nuclease family protein [Rhynchospora pubera]|uniref:Ca(2+)-dependent nuclease family protein n=1 Tax=Rhynchospora pubera TaxID=906938 RepID=A0AAV8E886_9POAL|nr:Ca(2+)-dependent nuclease family protein [Rhynchospora pubera]